VGADWGSPSTAQSLRVTMSGNSTLLQKTVTVYGPGDSSSKYTSTNFTFVADSGNTTLTFQDVSPTGLNFDLLLDSVQISSQSARTLVSVAPTILAAHTNPISITRAAEGLWIYTGAGGSGIYELQSSGDLRSWNVVDTRQSSGESRCEFLVTNAAERIMFYRIVLH